MGDSAQGARVLGHSPSPQLCCNYSRSINKDSVRAPTCGMEALLFEF